jgi:hypothetical protein
MCESKAPAGALAAARDRPRGRRAATRTQRRLQSGQTCAARPAQERSRGLADEAAPRQQ